MDMDLSGYTSEETSPMELPLKWRLLIKVWAFLITLKDGSIKRRVEKFFDRKVPAATRKGVSARDVIIDYQTGVWIRIFTPQHQASDRQLPVIFYFHGGGFTMLSANSHFPDSFARYACRTFQAMVISVDYRKTPEHRYPVAYDDCHAAVRWVAESADLPNADMSKCFFVGESAGGNIVHHVACRVASDSVMEGRLTVLGNVVLVPFFGGEERTSAELRLLKIDPILNYVKCDAAWRLFLPPDATRDHPAANVCGPEAPDLSTLPLAPFFVSVGEYDSLKDWQVRYAQALQRMGKHVELRFYKGGVHGFHAFPRLKLTAQFRADMEQFVRSKLL